VLWLKPMVRRNRKDDDDDDDVIEISDDESKSKRQKLATFHSSEWGGELKKFNLAVKVQRNSLLCSSVVITLDSAHFIFL
jgi:hypothetical protein